MGMVSMQTAKTASILNVLTNLDIMSALSDVGSAYTQISTKLVPFSKAGEYYIRLVEDMESGTERVVYRLVVANNTPGTLEMVLDERGGKTAIYATLYTQGSYWGVRANFYAASQRHAVVVEKVRA